MEDTALLVSGFNGVAYSLSALVPIPLIERVGRRKLMLLSVAGQACCMMLLAGMTQDVGNKVKGYVVTVMLFVFNFFFSCGLLPIPWLYPAEISPLAVRAQGAGLATMTNWSFTFLVVTATPTASEKLGWKFYLVWACTNAAFVPITYFFYVETTGQTLEDIDTLFAREQSWFIGPKSARLARENPRSSQRSAPGTLTTGITTLNTHKAGLPALARSTWSMSSRLRRRSSTPRRRRLGKTHG
ncbi:hypothetical protein JCM10908_000337 [Rhodotorula pacifica]|uniref:uncharacterized protein n=1 Tax=Rhodotorula pacifica TaxID=1495444 RepID=UPI00318056C5